MPTAACMRCATAARKCRTPWWWKAADTAAGTFRCRTHGLEFDFEGRCVGGGRGNLTTTRAAYRRSSGLGRSAPGASIRRDARHRAATCRADARRRRAPQRPSEREIEVAANWKLLVEQWLEAVPAEAAAAATADSITWSSRPLEGGTSFSARCYRSLVKDARRRGLAAALRRAEPIAAMASRRTHGHPGDPRIAADLPPAAHLRCPHARGPEARAGALPRHEAHALDAGHDARGRGVRAARRDGLRISSRRRVSRPP